MPAVIRYLVHWATAQPAAHQLSLLETEWLHQWGSWFRLLKLSVAIGCSGVPYELPYEYYGASGVPYEYYGASSVPYEYYGASGVPYETLIRLVLYEIKSYK
ncbi:hypothetical protein TNCV_3807501 [Trichonephila clavipes]|nr:hypothetical protein TNCV_3807501 [Trichonephila clavipes]